MMQINNWKFCFLKYGGFLNEGTIDGFLEQKR